MKWIHKLFEMTRPWVEPGGWAAWGKPIYDAADAFLFTVPTRTRGAPHVRDAMDIKRFMTTVIVALVPCTLWGIFNAGYQYHVANQITGVGIMDHLLRGSLIVMPIILVSYAVGGFWEVLFACIRKHEINEGLLVTGLLFPLTLPPTIPLWQVAVGISFGVVIGKEIFGGTGYNVFNPALVGRCFLFFAYPAQISGDNVWVKVLNPSQVADGFTGATPLAVAKTMSAGSTVPQALTDHGYPFWKMLVGLEPGSIGETSTLMVLAGAAILILTGVGAWRIMAGGLIAMATTCWLSRLLPIAAGIPHLNTPTLWHLVMGGFAFGLVFMATDPVSAAISNAGKWIYGALIGFMTAVIRLYNPAFMEGTMLAILFANALAPLIDYGVLQVHMNRRMRRLNGARG